MSKYCLNVNIPFFVNDDTEAKQHANVILKMIGLVQGPIECNKAILQETYYDTHRLVSLDSSIEEKKDKF